MKIELARNSVVLEIDHIGRHIFISEGGASSTQGFFDEAEAKQAVAALVASRLAAGWAPTPAQRAKEQRAAEQAQRAPALQAHIDDAIAAAAADADDGAKAGARALLRCLAGAPRFEELIARVVAVEEGGDLRLTGGARLTLALRADRSTDGVRPWFVPTRELSCLWLYGDDDDVARGAHALFFGAEAGPPEAEHALARTPFADADVEWFIEESPFDRYWFYVADDGVARCCEFDGGVRDDVHDGPLADLLVARLLTLLDTR